MLLFKLAAAAPIKVAYQLHLDILPVCFKLLAISLIANALSLNAFGKIIPSFVTFTFFKFKILAIAESTSLTLPI